MERYLRVPTAILLSSSSSRLTSVLRQSSQHRYLSVASTSLQNLNQSTGGSDFLARRPTWAPIGDRPGLFWRNFTRPLGRDP